MDTLDVGGVVRGVIIGGSGVRSWCLPVDGGIEF